MPFMSEGKHQKRYLQLRDYWRANVRLIQVLLLVWALTGLGGGVLWVKQLNQFSIGNLPLGFWLAQQGAIMLFVALIFIYARAMDALDKRYEVEE